MSEGLESGESFDSDADLIRFLQERSDDIDGLTVLVPSRVQATGPNGQVEYWPHVALIAWADGNEKPLPPEDLELLLNDGILQRMKIKISVKPIPEQPHQASNPSEE